MKTRCMALSVWWMQEICLFKDLEISNLEKIISKYWGFGSRKIIWKYTWTIVIKNMLKGQFIIFNNIKRHMTNLMY